MPINIAELINDPDFAQPEAFTVIRQTGRWFRGRFEDNAETFSMSGVITPENTKDTIQTPDGDRITGYITLYTTEPLQTSRLRGDQSTTNGVADQVAWQGENWKIVQSQNYSDYGYYKSIAVRVYAA